MKEMSDIIVTVGTETDLSTLQILENVTPSLFYDLFTV